MVRDLRLIVGLPLVTVIVAALVLLAFMGSSSSPPTNLLVPAGTVYRLGYLRDVLIHFSVSSTMTVSGAWTSDAPVGTQIVSANYQCDPIGNCPHASPGCSVTYNATFSPGDYLLELAAPYMQTANVTVTQPFRLVTPAANATAVPPVANVTPTEIFWTPVVVGTCPA